MMNNKLPLGILNVYETLSGFMHFIKRARNGLIKR
ncbi:uncharacterized protein METZ01_LOCUS286707 [marine metagenome]|uniref:Uncharacterized protein n=1 Tax=marine metagenome TaxID=408172 RepID=A0A382LCP2_9ZZZZ